MDYACSACGAKGVKLWRQYNAFLDDIRLLCCACAEVDQGKVCTLRTGTYPEHGVSDQIGWLVPAVPVDQLTEQVESFWGYTTVPPTGVWWWQCLPLETWEQFSAHMSARSAFPVPVPVHDSEET